MQRPLSYGEIPPAVRIALAHEYAFLPADFMRLARVLGYARWIEDAECALRSGEAPHLCLALQLHGRVQLVLLANNGMISDRSSLMRIRSALSSIQ